MQHLNDDMDELYRKAADDYPLNTGKPDWDRVAAGLRTGIPEPVPTSNRYRRFLWLLLLIPFAGGIYLLAGSNHDEKDGTTIINGNEQISATARGNVIDAEKIPGDVKNNNVERSGASRDNTKQTPDSNMSVSTNDDADVTTTNNDRTENTRNALAKKPVKNVINKKYKLSTMSGSTTRSGQMMVAANNKFKGANSTEAKSGSGNDERSENSKSVPDVLQNKPSSDYIVSANEGADASTEPEPSTKIFLADNDAGINTNAIMPLLGTNVKAGPMQRPQLREKRFYIGAIGGLDATTVSLQKVSKTGSHYGGMVGYNLSRKFSIEAGFFVEKKYYFTEGKYFDKTKVYLPPNTLLESAEGFCKMFEIPISLRYDIRNTFRSNFFATAGVSSYIMKREDYDMVYLYSSGGRSNHAKSWTNSSKNLLSELRLTTGYSVKIPAGFSFRVEPYLNVPIGKVGYGKLKLMSAGVNAGIFKRLF